MQMLKINMKIPKIDIHVAHGCNLRCAHCLHYSNLVKGSGLVSLGEIKSWIWPWQYKISPGTVNILGGEPLLNPEIGVIVEEIQRCWPQSRRCLATNGLLLDKHPDLGKILEDTNTELWASSYSTNEKTVNRHKRERDDLNVYEPSVWVQHYIMKDGKLHPHGSNPKEAWQRCVARTCLQLFEGKIWKCPAIAYLKLVPKLSAEWDEYLEYKPLSPDCSVDEMKVFFTQQEESICSMCPANENSFIRLSSK